ncbi:MAG TPA: ribose ABC transporter permease [Opitutaceae bacterium]|jgi:ribose transport system permease protein|nr:ribose ABC transporter permease [Opitutaceae bacterium]
MTSVSTPRNGPRMSVRHVLKSVGILPMLLGVILLFALLTPKFLTADNGINVARQASINLVLAAGMTFVILTRGIDLAAGSVLGVSAVISVMLSLTPVWTVGAVPLSLAVGALLGAGTGAVVAYGGLPPFIVTLGTYTALRGAAYLLADGKTVINNDLSFAWIGNDYLGPVPWLVVIAGLVVVGSWFLLRKTVLGLHIYAVGGNPEAARLTGINVGRTLVVVYALSGLFSALGGVMSASRLYSANGQLGTGYELDAIAAVILGGTSFSGGMGGITGTLYGALVIAVLNNGLTLMNVSYFWQLVVKGLVIVLAVAMDRLRSRHAAD